MPTKGVSNADNKELLQDELLKILTDFSEKSIEEQLATVEKIKNYFVQFPYNSPKDAFVEEQSDPPEGPLPEDDPVMVECRKVSGILQNQSVLFAMDAINDAGTFEYYSLGRGFSDFSSIRLSLASNAKTPVELLEIIAEEEALDWDEFFPEVLANNPNSSAKVIEELVMRSTYERGFDEAAILAIKHPNTDSSLLEKLLEEDFREWVNVDFQEDVLPVIVRHHNLPRKKVLEFLDHEDSGIILSAKLNLAGRADTSVNELFTYALDDDIQIRASVFHNPNATEEIRTSAALLGVEYDKVAE